LNGENFWKIKLKALLHDPPHKTFVRIYQRTNHEEIAEELLKSLIGEDLDLQMNIEEVKNADKIASAMSRLLVEGVRWQPAYKDLSYIDPFTLQQFPLKEVNTAELADFFNKAGTFIKSLKGEKKYKTAFLYCWRFMPHFFSNWLLQHPADDRACNHSVYDHAVQTSAIAGALPRPVFLFFTIGGVQQFISSSRKTQDLWSSSYLLSCLMWTAIEPIIDEFGPDALIYPSLLANPFMDSWLHKYFKAIDFPDSLAEYIKILEDNTKPPRNAISYLPNTFLAILLNDRAKEIARDCVERFNNKLREIWGTVTEKVFNDARLALPDSLFSLYWVILPWSLVDINSSQLEQTGQKVIEEYGQLFGETAVYKIIKEIAFISSQRRKFFNLGTTYSLLYQMGRSLLRSRKLIRDFTQIEEKGRYRCSLCGIRSPICDNPENVNAYWDALRERFPALVREGERLCPLCALKRFAPSIYFKDYLQSDPSNFPSTYEVATAVYKHNLSHSVKKEFKDFYDEFRRCLREAGCRLPITNSVPKLKGEELSEIDGQWLMEESYRADYISREYGGDKEKVEEILHQMEEQRGAILKKLKDELGEPPTYYAILFLDGDEIGKWLGGEKLPQIEELLNPLFGESYVPQSDIRDLMDKKHPISPSFHQILSRKMGEFSLNDLPKITENNYGVLVYSGGDDALALFSLDSLLPALNGIWQSWFNNFQKLTISAGVAIAHCKMHLQRALEIGRMALYKAKQDYGRDSFCITTLPRSGELLEGGSKWSIPWENSNLSVSSFLNELAEGFASAKLSGRFPYQFAKVVQEVRGNREVLGKELVRIFERKEARDPQILNKLQALFQQTQTDKFANLLLISHFIGTRGCKKRNASPED